MTPTPPPPSPPECMPKTALPFQLGSYVPRADEKFWRWAFVLTGRIAQDPAGARVSQQEAQELLGMFHVFDGFYKQSRQRGSRTLDIVGRKNAARKILEEMCRKVAQKIKHDQSVPFAIKNAIFRRARLRRKSTGSLDSHPTLYVTEMRSGRHVLRWSDDSTPWSRRKPKGAVAMQIFACVAERAVIDHKRLQYVGTFTKQPMKVSWPPETAGLVVTYVGRWISAKGEEGSWSQALPVQVAFAGVGLMQIDRARQVASMHEYRRAA